MAAIVTDLYFYPIKSFRGFRVKDLSLGSQGAEWDRQWMLVDEKNNMLTMRQLPQLARIGVNIDDFMELTLEGFGSVDFGMQETEGDELTVKVWDDSVKAFEVSSEVSEWLSQVLSKKVKLVRFSDTFKRQSQERPESGLRFHDGQPLLVISKASLLDLEKQAGVTLSMSRFRPNIVIDGVPAYAEDTQASFKLGNVEFVAVKPCTRCKITTVHPLTGELGEEPLKTLNTYRKGPKGPTFGFYFAHKNNGRIHVGQELRCSLRNLLKLLTFKKVDRESGCWFVVTNS